MSVIPPRVFASYSHDTEEHENWILNLATRLVANGVEVILDQWDLTLGADLPRFMEVGLTEADRVLAVCTSSYVKKANAGEGGVGYEKMILTAQLMRELNSDLVIPVVRSTSGGDLVPIFLSSRLYIDFRDDANFETKYAELLREIHGEQIRPRPPLGTNPFKEPVEFSAPNLSSRPERYVSAALTGEVTFDYSNNNGRYVIGAGDMAFEIAWSRGGNSAIHGYSDPPSIRTVAVATGVEEISDIIDASSFDVSSRARTPRLGQILVWQNSAGYYAATRIEALKSSLHGDDKDEITFSYVIQQDRSSSFAPRAQDA